ncbi:protease Lon-related BREX system protein BrxL [Leptospira levettii]|uniref:protease Lon-related BREX system protein BrxL n=1 Tax=Leptospira levettii TaxID=2023178 RepID=UPI003EB84134
MTTSSFDIKLAKNFEGLIVRKDLVRKFSRQYPVPTYVVEFLLGRYCATTDESEIEEGLKIVQKQLNERTVRAGEEELFKSRAKESGRIKLIDIISARLDEKTDSYVATLPSLQLKNVRITPDIIRENERILTGGFYAEITLSYDTYIAQEDNGRAFGVDSLRPIQISKKDTLTQLFNGRLDFTTDEWKDALLQSIGFNPSKLSLRNKDAILLRLVPFVERNYNLIELGPRGTGKSHLFQQVSPYAHLVSGGKATVAKMFVNNANGQRGLVCQYDVVCFDEVSGISFDQKDGVNIMKGYMESGEFSRGKESIRAEGSMVMVGNFDVDVQHQQRVGHLFGPLPPEMRDDTAFMDRIHCYLPGWDIPKTNPDLYTSQFGLVSDFLSQCFTELRRTNRSTILQNRVHFGGALSGRDLTAVNKTVSGLMKLMFPNPDMPVSDEDLEWAIRLSLEVRRRVKEQQKRIGSAEFRNTHFSYTMGADGVEKFVSTPELFSENAISSDPMEPGLIWTISTGTTDEGSGLFKIEISEGPGSGVKILNRPSPPSFSESVKCAEQNFYSKKSVLVGDRDPRSHEFMIQLRSFDAANSGKGTGVAVLMGLASSLLKKSIKGGLVVIGELNLGGSIEIVYNPVSIVELAVEKGALSILMPVSCRRQLLDLSDDMATKIDIQFYLDIRDALLKALAE